MPQSKNSIMHLHMADSCPPWISRHMRPTTMTARDTAPCGYWLAIVGALWGVTGLMVKLWTAAPAYLFEKLDAGEMDSIPTFLLLVISDEEFSISVNFIMISKFQIFIFIFSRIHIMLIIFISRRHEIEFISKVNPIISGYYRKILEKLTYLS